ncbi:MAG: sugar phosphate isomerase/epimerase family protein [Chloroflexota bacterium]
MKISCCWLYAISKFGYPPSIANTYAAIDDMAGLGFRYIELEGVGEANLRAVWEERHGLRKRCEDLGLKVINFCPVLPDLVSLDPAARRRALESFDLAVGLANYFGCESIQADSYAPPLEFLGDRPYKETINFGGQFRVKVNPDFRWEELWANLVDSVSCCARSAEQGGLRFCLEPRVGENVSNTDALLRLMEAVNNPNFGAVLDTGHLHAQKEILPLSVEKLGKRIFYLHVSDNDGRTNEHLALGRGTVDWEGVFGALAKHGYRGYVAIDVGRVPDLDLQYQESVCYLEALSQRLGFELEG